MDPSTPRRAARRTGPTVATLLATALLAAALVVPAVAPTRAPATRTVATQPQTAVVAADPVRSRRTYPIAADAPDTAATGTGFAVVGTASTTVRRTRVPRPVLLRELLGGSWVTLQRVHTSAYGEFSFPVDAGLTVTTRTLRVDAPAYRGLRPARTGPLVVEVVGAADPTDPTVPPEPTTGYDAPEPLPPGYVGAGSPGAWSYLFAGGGRWNPCEVIRWAYNPEAEGYPALADVQRAMALISGASGLRFTYVGSTTWRYLGDLGDPAFPADRADIVVGWASALELPVLAGNVVGYGGGSGRSISGGDVRALITRGFLTLDNGHVLPGGFDQPGWGQITLHEILHAVGLGHVGESVQIMYGMAHRGNTRFGAGDLTGMQMIGASRGCLS